MIKKFLHRLGLDWLLEYWQYWRARKEYDAARKQYLETLSDIERRAETIWGKAENENGKPTWQTHACFGRNCAEWAAGAPHKCEIGRCKKFERALAEWGFAQREEEVYRAEYAAVALTLEQLSNEELAAINNVAQVDWDPRNVVGYEKVKHLFTENDGMKMHNDVKEALARVVLQRLKEA